MPCCYFLRGCWKTCFRTAENEKKLQCLGHKCFSEKLRCCWHMLAKKIGESLVPYFTCHTATFEGDVEKHVFSQFCNNCWKGEKLQCLGHKCFFLKSCDVADKCWHKIGESLVPYFTCHTATFEGDVEKHVFPSFATTAERKKCCDTLTASLPFATTAERKKCCGHSYSVTPILQQLLCDTLTASLPLNWMAMTCASSTQLHFQQEPHFQWVSWPFNSNPTITSPKIWQERRMGLDYLSVVVRISAHPHFSGRPILLSCQILISAALQANGSLEG